MIAHPGRPVRRLVAVHPTSPGLDVPQPARCGIHLPRGNPGSRSPPRFPGCSASSKNPPSTKRRPSSQALALLLLIAQGIGFGRRRLPPLFWAALVGLLVLLATPRLSPGWVPSNARRIQVPLPGGLPPADRTRRPRRQPQAPGLVHVGGVGRATRSASGPTSIACTTRAENSVRQSEQYRVQYSAVEIAGPSAQPGSGSGRSSRPPRNTWRPSAPSAAAATRPLKSPGNRRSFDPRRTSPRPAPSACGSSPPLARRGAGRRPRRRPADRRHEQGRVHNRRDGTRAPAEGASESSGVEFILPRGGAWLGLCHPPTPVSTSGASRTRRPFRSSSPPGVEGLELRIPPDRASVPWRLLIRSRSRITVCGLARDHRDEGTTEPGGASRRGGPRSHRSPGRARGSRRCLGSPAARPALAPDLLRR